MTAKPVPEQISDERLAEMLAAAEKATPGKRRITKFNGIPNAVMAPDPDFGGIAICTIAVHRDIHANAELIRAFDPDTIREILTELTTLRSQLSGMTEETSSPFDRDQLGRFVREAWVRWAETQPSPKASWLLPYDDLSEPDKEADRQIGEAVARWVLIGHEARSSLTSAPDLLSVLRRIEPALAAEVNTRGDEDGKYAFPMRPLLGIVSGAIAKAEGQS
jgi:hypothetical protein